MLKSDKNWFKCAWNSCGRVLIIKFARFVSLQIVISAVTAQWHVRLGWGWGKRGSRWYSPGRRRWERRTGGEAGGRRCRQAPSHLKAATPSSQPPQEGVRRRRRKGDRMLKGRKGFRAKRKKTSWKNKWKNWRKSSKNKRRKLQRWARKLRKNRNEPWVTWQFHNEGDQLKVSTLSKTNGGMQAKKWGPKF